MHVSDLPEAPPEYLPRASRVWLLADIRIEGYLIWFDDEALKRFNSYLIGVLGGCCFQRTASSVGELYLCLDAGTSASNIRLKCPPACSCTNLHQSQISKIYLLSKPLYECVFVLMSPEVRSIRFELAQNCIPNEGIIPKGMRSKDRKRLN